MCFSHSCELFHHGSIPGHLKIGHFAILLYLNECIVMHLEAQLVVCLSQNSGVLGLNFR